MHWIDPQSLPELHGTVTSFLLNPHGEMDGIILGSQSQVHFPPHLSDQVARHVAVGDQASIRGVKPRGANMISAVSIQAKDGTVILDNGPQDHGDKHHKPPHVERQTTDAAGTVVLSLYGPKGELRGALLDSGTSLRMSPHAAAELAPYLTPGMQVQAWGKGIQNERGSTIEVAEIAELIDTTA